MYTRWGIFRRVLRVSRIGAYVRYERSYNSNIASPLARDTICERDEDEQGHAIPAIHPSESVGISGLAIRLARRSGRARYGDLMPPWKRPPRRENDRVPAHGFGASSRRGEKEISFSGTARVSPRRIHYRRSSVLYTCHR